MTDIAKNIVENLEGQKQKTTLPIGYKGVIIEELPSMGKFYPKDVKISIKPAELREIRHWSTIEENDPISVDGAMNLIMERCVSVSSREKPLNYQSLKEIDRLYLIFAVREISFQDNENVLKADYFDGETKKTTELRKEMISYFEIPEIFNKFYSETERNFIFYNPKDENEKLRIYFPSIGSSKFFEEWKNKKTSKGTIIKDDFQLYGQFLINDQTKEKEIDDLLLESNNWSLWKVSALSMITSEIVNAINPKMKIKKDNGDFEVLPLNFLGGFKAIFLISNPLG